MARERSTLPTFDEHHAARHSLHRSLFCAARLISGILAFCCANAFEILNQLYNLTVHVCIRAQSIAW